MHMTTVTLPSARTSRRRGSKTLLPQRKRRTIKDYPCSCPDSTAALELPAAALAAREPEVLRLRLAGAASGPVLESTAAGIALRANLVDPVLSEAMAVEVESALIDQVALGPDSAEWEQAAQASPGLVSEPSAVSNSLPVWFVPLEHLAGLLEMEAAETGSALIDQVAPGPDSAD